MRGSVFNIEFRVLARESESIETFQGFARLLEKTGFKIIKSILYIFQDNKKVKWESLELNIAISRKNIESKYLCNSEKGQEMEMTEKPENWQCALLTQFNFSIVWEN